MSINKRRRKKIKVRQDSYLSTSRRGTREIRPRHSLSRAQHRTAPYIYTRTHFNTSLPLPDSFPSEIFFSLLPYSPCYLSIFLTPSLFLYFTGLSLFLSVAFPCRIPFHCLTLPFYLTPISPSISLSHRPAGNLVGLPFLRHLFFFSLRWWTGDRVARYPQHRKIVTSTALFVDRYKRRVGRG